MLIKLKNYTKGDIDPLNMGSGVMSTIYKPSIVYSKSNEVVKKIYENALST